MKEKLKKIREPQPLVGKAQRRLFPILIFLAGTLSGVFAKWLDELALDSTIGWHRVLEKLDLGNVFSSFAVWLLSALIIAVFSRTPGRAALNTFLFFAGMCIAYHLYTVGVSGFNPWEYMMIWYVFTILSPLLALFCWYAKGKTVISIVLCTLIFAVLALCCFHIGWVYFSLKGIIYLLIFAAALPVLYASAKQLAISLPAGLVLAFLVSPVIGERLW